MGYNLQQNVLWLRRGAQKQVLKLNGDAGRCRKTMIKPAFEKLHTSTVHSLNM